MAWPACPTYTMSHSQRLNSYTACYENVATYARQTEYTTSNATRCRGIMHNCCMDCLVKTTMIIWLNLNILTHIQDFKMSHSWCLAMNMLQQDIAIKFPSGRRNNDPYQPVVIRLSTTDCHNHLSSFEKSEGQNSDLQDHSVDEKCST